MVFKQIGQEQDFVTRYRNIDYVLHNYQPYEREQILNHPFVKYGCVGYERTKENIPHHQGFLQFTTSLRFTQVKSVVGKVASFRSVRDPTRCNLYCQKGDQSHDEWDALKTEGPNYGKNADVMKKGEFKESVQGKRSDIQAPAEVILNGGSTTEVAMNYPAQFVKYHRGFYALQNELIAPRTDKPTVIVYYGKTGTGKSYNARKDFTDAGIFDDFWFWNPLCTNWFDQYNGQRGALFEEFRGDFSMGAVLALTDRYAMRVPIKGSFVQWAPELIIFTSPMHPKEWYINGSNDSIDQLLRRIDIIKPCLIPFSNIPANTASSSSSSSNMNVWTGSGCIPNIFPWSPDNLTGW